MPVGRGTAAPTLPPTEATARGAPSPQPGALGRRLRYLPGLDGIRALAVLAVAGYHADLSIGGTHLVRGGFLGVEVFFVLSGYLITTVLLDRLRRQGTIDLRSFYAGRARRLVPAMVVMLAAVVLLSVVFLPGELATLRGDAIASLTPVTNWFFILSDASYFEAVGRPPLLRHVWSLAVEWQFSLLWPLALVAGMRWLGRRRLALATLIGAVASAALMAMLHIAGADLTRLYEGTDTRAAGLLAGAAAAFVWAPPRLRRTVGVHAPDLLDTVGVLAAVLLVIDLLVSDQYADSLYRFGFARTAALTVVVIAIAVHPAARLGRWLGCRPLRWIGRRSYGVYLIHWPVFQLTRPGLDVPWSGLPLLALRLGLTGVLADLSYRYIEMPVRQGALGRAAGRVRDALRLDPGGTVRRWVGLSGACGMLAVACVAAVLRAAPPPAPAYLATGPHPEPAHDAGGLPAAVAEAPAAATLPPTTSAPAPARRVTAVGDSVMLGAEPALRARLPGELVVDASVSRQVGEGIDALRSHRDAGQLGDAVVVHLGDNGTFRRAEVDELRQLLAGVPRVVIVNVRVPRPWEGHNNELIAEALGGMPNAVPVDWHARTESRPELFYDDGTHLRPEGAALYADLIVAAL